PGPSAPAQGRTTPSTPTITRATHAADITRRPRRVNRPPRTLGAAEPRQAIGTGRATRTRRTAGPSTSARSTGRDSITTRVRASSVDTSVVVAMSDPPDIVRTTV